MTSKDRKNENIDASRRGFSKLGVAVPVVMTLASKPVLGAQCLSNALSGNLSDPDRGNCGYGFSPGGWKAAGGSQDWGTTPFIYSPYAGGDKQVAANYQGGTTLGDSPLAGLGGGAYDHETLTGLMWEFPGNSDVIPFSHYIAALLNATSSQVPSYALTVNQLLGLITGAIPVPGGLSLTAYLDTTWT